MPFGIDPVSLSLPSSFLLNQHAYSQAPVLGRGAVGAIKGGGFFFSLLFFFLMTSARASSRLLLLLLLWWERSMVGEGERGKVLLFLCFLVWRLTRFEHSPILIPLRWTRTR